MKSLLRGFKCLNYDDLILVNGGYGGGSGGGGPVTSGYSSSRSGGYSGSSGGSSSRTSGASLAGIVGAVSANSVSSSGYSGSSGGCSGSRSGYSGSSGGYSGFCGGYSGSSGVHSYYDGSNSRSIAAAKGYSVSSGFETVNINSAEYAEDGVKSAERNDYGASAFTQIYIENGGDNIVAGDTFTKLNNKGFEGFLENMTCEQREALYRIISDKVLEEPGEYVLGVNDCDHYVENILKEAGFKMEELWGNATTFNCEDHITKLQGQLFTEPRPGWNIALLNDGKEYVKADGTKGIANAHAALVYISENGAVDIYQQTKSVNTGKHESYEDVASFQKSYLYNGFNYVPLYGVYNPTPKETD